MGTSFVCDCEPTWPGAKCNEFNRFAPLTNRHTAINNNRAPNTNSTALMPACATGGTLVANFIRFVISSGRPSMPSSNQIIGNIISGNVATCLMSITCDTAKLIWTRAFALNEVPIN